MKKTFIWIGLFAGSTIGSFIPMLWNADFLSTSSIIFSGLGGLLGIWVGYKLGRLV